MDTTRPATPAERGIDNSGRQKKAKTKSSRNVHWVEESDGLSDTDDYDPSEEASASSTSDSDEKPVNRLRARPQVCGYAGHVRRVNKHKKKMSQSRYQVDVLVK